MKKIYLLVVFSISILQGCAALTPQPISFNTDKGRLSFTKSGCALKDFKYTDTSGMGENFPIFRMISLDPAENTKDEFSVNCQPVLPNRTSNCSHFSKTQYTYMDYGGPGCPDLNRFSIFYYRNR